MIDDNSELSYRTISESETDEDYKLGRKHPLKTVLSLCAGPLINNFVKTLQDAIHLYFVGVQYGDDGVVAVGMSGYVTMIATLVSMFGSVSVPITVSRLVAEKKYDVSSQLIADLIRMGLFVTILLSGTLTFAAKPLLIYLGMTKELIDDTVKYCYPFLFLSGLMSIFYSLCSALLGEAKAFLSAVFQLSAIVISLFIFDPIFIFWLKLPIWSVGFAVVSGPVILSFVLFSFYFFQSKKSNIDSMENQNLYVNDNKQKSIAKKLIHLKFVCKPTLSMIFKKFTFEILIVLKDSLPFVLTGFAGCFPPIFLVKYAILAGDNAGIGGAVNAVVSAAVQPYNVINTIVIGLVQGLAPPASYAHAKRMFSRLLKLLLYVLIVPFMVTIPVTPVFIFWPDKILKIWISGADSLELSKAMVPPMFYTNWLFPISEALTGFLIATGSGALANVVPIARGVGMLAGTFGLYYASDKKSPGVVFMSFMTQDAGLLLSSIFCALPTIVKVVKSMKYDSVLQEGLIN
ncbi:hypothetical protein TRFO_41988 [Tritrichomonas foetus]|uniref:MatE family protein n=1 Tax=Tritrichomonas foetus TaxID=1144522 RepID=A0A1J4L2K0_9EUKA|nr:hypothetical protein TRFO_41988 [Tritrichomonas foetus]|eukprot:OHT16174.1 hypothetical protein TRFO_41988 [Tritrichomonas foetus]